MSPRATNLALLVLLTAELVSGLAGFVVGAPSGRWVFWLHGVGGFALVLLLAWKWRIVARSFARRGAGPWAVAPAALGVCVLGALVTGLAWSTVGLPPVPLPGVGRASGLTLHVLLALLSAPLLIAHALMRWPRPRRADLVGRRAALRMLGLLGGGLVAWRAVEAGARVLAFDGAGRRFTGSREAGSLGGNAHPVTNWLSDRVRRFDAASWRLAIDGAVARPYALSYDELATTARTAVGAILDCTGGWYTEQRWSGVPLSVLVAAAGPSAGARSVVVRSATGYARRFAFDEAAGLLLATHVGGAPLSTGHGFPARLVAPDRRGFAWVKWVTAVEVSERPAWWQPPLPLQ